MVFAMLKKAYLAVKATVVSSLPFCGPPLDYGLSLLSKAACGGCEAGTAGAHFASRDGLGARLYCKLADAGHFSGEAGMNQVVMIDCSKTEEILHTAIDQKVTAIMSYLSKGKWHVAKVLITAIDAATLSIQTTHSYKKQQPINININQPVGVSFKYEYGKFVCDTTVVGLESANPIGRGAGGTIVLKMPEQIECFQRRSYFRVEVPESLKVNVTLWHRKPRRERLAANGREESQQASETSRAESMPVAARHGTDRYSRGRLVDISAGGAQVVLDAPCEDDSGPEPQFRKGQFIGIRFTPFPYETPLLLNAQIRNALPRADGNSIYLGLQIIGLEASPEGRKVLARLVGVVERYYKMNQAGAQKKDKNREAATA